MFKFYVCIPIVFFLNSGIVSTVQMKKYINTHIQWLIAVVFIYFFYNKKHTYVLVRTIKTWFECIRMYCYRLYKTMMTFYIIFPHHYKLCITSAWFSLFKKRDCIYVRTQVYWPYYPSVLFFLESLCLLIYVPYVCRSVIGLMKGIYVIIENTVRSHC